MQFDERCFQLRETNKWTARVESATAYIVDHAVEVPMTSAMQRAWAVTWSRWPFGWLYTAICTVLTAVRRRRYRWLHHPAWANDWQSRQLDFAPARAAHQTVNARQIKQRCAAHQRVNDVSGFCALGNRQTMMSDNRRRSLYPQICIEYSRLITCQSSNSKGRGHDRLPNWNSKNGGMLISQPISRCLTNHSELCMSRLLNNQPRRICICRLQRPPSFGFESSVSSTPMTSGDPVFIPAKHCISKHVWMIAGQASPGRIKFIPYRRVALCPRIFLNLNYCGLIFMDKTSRISERNTSNSTSMLRPNSSWLYDAYRDCQ